MSEESMTLTRGELSRAVQSERVRLGNLCFLTQSALRALIASHPDPFDPEAEKELAEQAGRMARIAYKVATK